MSATDLHITKDNKTVYMQVQEYNTNLFKEKILNVLFSSCIIVTGIY